MAFKSPLDQANSIMPESTKSKWDRYFKHIGDGNPRTVDKYNKLIQEIESEMPFENEDEHKKWLDLGSTWTGESEWPDMTEKIIARLDVDDFEAPEDIDADYERSYGPVDTREKYNAYKKWLKNGE